MALETILEELGITAKESAVYLAVLELGQAAVLRIAYKAGIKRPTAYVTLASLHEKGFVEVIPKGTTTLYQAVDPEILYRRFEEKLKTFGSALPELRSILNAAPGKPKVRFYEGKKSMLALYENEIFCAQNIIGAVSMRDIRKVLTQEEQMGLLHLLKAGGGRIRDLLEDSPEAQEYLNEKNRLQLGESKFLPSDLQFGVDILVYDQTVVMISPKPLIAVVIEDRGVSSAQRQFLEFLWKSIPSSRAEFS